VGCAANERGRAAVIDAVTGIRAANST